MIPLSPLISVVSGTYNRIKSLQRMVNSVRRNIPSGIDYEIVLVDGGSNDGTIQWCEAQPDIRLIEHHALKGAIVAFCDGAYAARGQYVILANDDIEFVRGSILAAYVYLDSTPTCGAVAFKDTRPVTIEGTPTPYKVQLQAALREDGTPTQTIYAQVGMFRKAIGDSLDWWGAHDPIMNKARTYGGDNYLSSKIYEAGLTIDAVDGARCDDHLVTDDLRKVNSDADSGVSTYWQRFPHGPRFNANPISYTPPPEALRVLYLPIFEMDSDRQRKNKRGLYDALRKVATVWQWDYLNTTIDTTLVAAFAPHVILSQFHDGKRGHVVDALRSAAPNALWVNWNGDARGLTEQPYLAMLHKVDLQLVVNASALSVYAQQGINAAYWQIGIEQVDYANIDYTHYPNHDVLFLANAYSPERRAIGDRLDSLTSYDVGLYGFGWQQGRGECLYDFEYGAALYHNARIAISDAFSDGKTPIEGFVSNRLFQALDAGAFVLQQAIPNLDKWTGLTDGIHYIEWKTLDDLELLIDYYIDKPDERAIIVEAGQRMVRQCYSFDRQVAVLFNELIPLCEATHEPA